MTCSEQSINLHQIARLDYNYFCSYCSPCTLKYETIVHFEHLHDCNESDYLAEVITFNNIKSININLLINLDDSAGEPHAARVRGASERAPARGDERGGADGALLRAARRAGRTFRFHDISIQADSFDQLRSVVVAQQWQFENYRNALIVQDDKVE